MRPPGAQRWELSTADAVARPVPTNADLGRAVRRLRRERRLTIEALAFASEMHPTYLSEIERGVRNPSWEKVASLARALGVPVSTLAVAAEREAEIALIVREARARIAADSR
jgi:transcriptional regulator with XRE-family HTH domain